MNPAGGTILVFGAGGQVGRELVDGGKPAGLSIVGLQRSDADISDAEAVRRAVERYRPAIVVNAAAYTAVDKAETEPALAHAVNAEGARHIAGAARALDAPIIHLSTDYVFAGTKGCPYDEDDAVGPVSVYGRTKEAGERAVREANPRHVILRTAWVYGRQGHNFVKTMLRLASERDVIRVVADQHGTPTAAIDLAQAIFAIIARLSRSEPAFGTFHLTNSGHTTWHGLAQRIFTFSAERGLRAPTLQAIATSDYPTAARRPAMSILDCSKISAAYGIRLRAWQDALDDVLRSLLTVDQTKLRGIA